MRERRLIRRLQARDEAAFREIVRTYQRPIYNLLWRMLGSVHEAEDVAQDVFITVFKAIDTFRQESSFKTWVYRIAVNHCHNRQRYLTRRGGSKTDSLDETVLPAEHEPPHATPVGPAPPRPDSALEQRELQQRLATEIAALDEGYRLLIILRDIQHLSYEEIGAIAALNPGTVKSRLHRARAALKARLEGIL